MQRGEFQFEWNDAKAAANIRKHGISFEQACAVFSDPNILTAPDIANDDREERWVSIGRGEDGVILNVVHLWDPQPGLTKIRRISARKSTRTEIGYYQGGT